MKNVTIEQILEVAKKVSDVRTGYHTKDGFICGLYDCETPATRCEIWKGNSYIDLWCGNATKIYGTAQSVMNAENSICAEFKTKKKSAKEICVRFTSFRAFELFMSNYYVVTPKIETKNKRSKNTRSQKKRDIA